MFDLPSDRDHVLRETDIPSCWSLESSAPKNEEDRWDSYWEGFSDDQQHLRQEAKEYVQRLDCALRLDLQARVLDFGCGCGFVAAALASRVGEVYLWDASANMRRRARLRLANHPNIRFLDLSDPNAVPSHLRFNLILVNSVVQYMKLQEFCGWLPHWRNMVADDGCIVVSDLIAPNYRSILDICDALAFSVRGGFLFSAISQAISDQRRYWKTRRSCPLTRIGREEVSRLARETGLDVRFLPENLTHFKKRFTAVFTKAERNASPYRNSFQVNASAGSHCFICDSEHFRRRFTKGGKDFVQCDRCGLLRLHPLPTFEELEEYYDREYAQETMMGAVLAAEEEMARVTARHRLAAIRQYTQGERLLDVGCSTGVFLHEVLKAGFQGEGIDISNTAIEKARSRNLNAYAATVENFNSEGPYDVVTGFDVIEHVLEPVSFLKTVYNLLQPGGIIALTTPDKNSLICRLMGRHWYFYIPEQHLFYFDCRNLSSLLERVGFHVLQVSKARKALNYNYSLLQFQAYNPFIGRVWNALGCVLPSFWRQRALTLYIGEMMIIARRANTSLPVLMAGWGCVLEL